MAEKHVKPNVSHTQATEMVKRLYRLTPSEIRPLPSYEDQNFYVAPIEGGEYVLKIMNSEDSKNLRLFEVQTYAMSFMHQNGFPVPTVLPTTTGQLISEENIDCGFGGHMYLVRLLTYLPGTTISNILVSPELLYEVGELAGKMNKTLQQMEHPHLGALQRDGFSGNLSYVPSLEKHINVLDGDPLQEVVKSVISLYKTLVVPKYSSFRKCINHGDLNDVNVLVQPDESGHYMISGIIDFADMNSGYYIHELAILIMYMMIEHPTPVEVGGPILAGWESVLPLNKAEKECLFLLVLCRFCQAIVLGLRAATLQPDNQEYLLNTPKKGVHILHQLWELGREEVERIWFEGAAQYNAKK